MAKKVVNSEWLDSDTFVVNFESTPTSEKFELEGVTEEVVVEYHKDENKWVVDKQYYDAEGGYIDHDTKAFTPYEEAEYLTIAQGYLTKETTESWDAIVVEDDYEAYDNLVDRIKARYCSFYQGDKVEEVSDEIEDLFNNRFTEILRELDKKYIK